MAVDITELRALVDQLETETAEAQAAKSDLDSKTAASTAAQDAMAEAVTAYTRENDERLAKMQEIIARLQAAVSEG